jgi:murein DD-endopeptidase MepM/ murein hydrolase activator NlpD
MIGLAISMGATGLLLTQNKAAVAANSLTATATLSNLSASLSSTNATSSSQSQLAPLNLKHKVKFGESIKQLAQEYQVEAAALANLNKLSVEADLVSGQILKIPSLEEFKLQAPPRQLGTILSKSQELPPNPVNTSLDHLRETRKRLQDSLAELKTEKSNLKSNISSLLANVSDVSQPLRPISSQFQENGSVRETTIQVITSPESVSASNLTMLVDTAGSLSSSFSSKNVSSTSTAEKTGENSPSTLSSFTKLPSVPLSQMEQAEIPQFNEPMPIPVSTPENDLASIAVFPLYSSPLSKSTFEPSKIGISVESTSTEQARIVSKPGVKLVQTKQSYRVQPGDTLNSIARYHGLTLSELIRANSITNPNLIKVHQSLVLPESATKAQYKNRPHISQSRNLVASSPSRFSNSPLPVSVSVPSSASPAEINRWEKQSSRNEDLEHFETTVNPSPDSYTKQLKTDIANLEQEYGVETGSGRIKTELDNQKKYKTPVLGQTLNPEWASDRRNYPSSKEDVAQQLPKFRSRLMGAAPNDAEQYNDAFRIPVGTNVGPELPPLSVPDNYLPNAPMQFTGYIWPSKGVLTSGYGRRWGRMHRGIDIAAPIGTPIIAAAPGEVITAGWNSGGYGKLVKVRHPDGSITLYAHNNRLLVRRGQKVEQGQQIAEMGSTGYSTGPHLHFEVHPSGTGAVNPVALLPKKRK